MESEDLVARVYYPTRIKLLGLVGVPALTVVGVYVTCIPFLDADVTGAQRVLMPLLGLAVVYQCYIGFRCLPHLNTVVSIYDEGIEVRKRVTSAEWYSWAELDVAEFPFATTTGIIKTDGSTVAYFSDGLPNLDLLVHMIRANKV